MDRPIRLHIKQDAANNNPLFPCSEWAQPYMAATNQTNRAIPHQSGIFSETDGFATVWRSHFIVSPDNAQTWLKQLKMLIAISKLPPILFIVLIKITSILLFMLNNFNFKLYTSFVMLDYTRLIETSNRRIRSTNSKFVRSIYEKINWKSRLIGIKGARGCGKTTLILQHLKNNHMDLVSQGKALYVSLDNLWFSGFSLLELADAFTKNGGRILCLDEIHKCENWPQLLKNIYDDYPELQVIFTGSSLLHLIDARGDLSRRAVMYEMQGLSFREFLNLRTGSDFKPIELEEILENHIGLAYGICDRIRPFEYFGEYLRTGYYPFFMEGADTYQTRLEETVNMILEIELPLLRGVDMVYVSKVKRLLALIAGSSPFVLNASKVAGAMELTRNTLISYLKSLDEAKLIKSLYKDSKGIGSLQKPDKVFLENTNLMYMFRGNGADIGSVRETFLVNQLSCTARVEFSAESDFLVNGKYTIECGVKNKTGEQIRNLGNAFIAADDIETGFGSKIPLWLFGFIY